MVRFRTGIFCKLPAEGLHVFPSSGETKMPCLKVPITITSFPAAMALISALAGRPVLTDFHSSDPFSHTNTPLNLVAAKTLLFVVAKPVTVASGGMPFAKEDHILPLSVDR